MLGEDARGRVVYERALVEARRSGDDWAIAMVLNSIADELAPRHPRAAREMFEESLAFRRRSGDPRGELFTLANLAEIALSDERLEAAETLARDVVERAAGVADDGSMSWGYGQLAVAALLAGDHALARVRVADALALHVDDVRSQSTLLAVAGTLVLPQDPAAAAQALGASVAALERAGNPPWRHEVRMRARIADAARAALGEAAFEAARAEGARLDTLATLRRLAGR